MVKAKIELPRTIRRHELKQIVPLADSTIYEMEQRGEFPKRYALSPRCVVSPSPEPLTCASDELVRQRAGSRSAAGAEGGRIAGARLRPSHQASTRSAHSWSIWRR
jgi:predicted DNA-binding transcriptional regulator AlpA